MTVTGVTWTGVDGSVWDLANGTQGVQLNQGISGLHLPGFTQQKSQAARVPGQRYLGTTYAARDAILAVSVGDQATQRTGAAWQALDAAWWASLSPERPGTLTVTSSRSGARSLSCRLAAAPDPVFTADPSQQGFAAYQLTLEADQPFWTSADVVTGPLVYSSAQVNFFGGGSGTKGPPFYIAAQGPFGGTAIANPGDRDAYARWTFVGPGSPSFSIGGHFTQLPTLYTGQTISIDTNPMAANAVVDVTGGGRQSFWPFIAQAHDFWAAIPAGSTSYPVPVTFSGGLAGTSSVTVALTPLYNRAW